MNIEQLEYSAQTDLFAHYQNLDTDEQKVLAKDLADVDYKMLSDLYFDLVISADSKTDNQSVVKIKPLPAESALDKAEIRALGEEAIKNNQLAVLLLAGGQGTRLGHKGPKGTFDLGVEGANSLFEIQANSLKTINQQYGVTLPWYIMTSEINHQETVDFFAENNNFAYPEESIHFFKQASIAALSENGKLLLADKTKLIKSPDGNGGCFKALQQYGIVDELLAKAYQWLFVYNVDNAITTIADVDFLGTAILKGNPCAVKVVPKLSADEKVGVPCLVDNNPTILEYTEIGTERANLRDDSGNLIYDGANIGNYLLELNSLQRLLEKPLNYHLAKKKVPYYQDGKIIEPETENVYKFELFIFDIFKSMAGMTVYQGKRENDFAPVKNKTGADSPETARALYRGKYARSNGK